MDMNKSVFIFSCLFFLNSYCFSQTRDKYEYTFSLPSPSASIEKDTGIAISKLPAIYIIHTNKELTVEAINKIKSCVENNNHYPNKCDIKNEYSINRNLNSFNFNN